MTMTTDLKNAKRFLSIQGIDKTGLDNADIIKTAIASGWQPSRPETAPSETTPAPTPAPTPTPRVNAPAPATDATAQALAALVASLQSAPQQIDEAQIIELIKKHASPVITVETHNVETGTKVKVKGAHNMLDHVLKRLNVGYNVYLYGAAGSGKTTLAEQCAESLGLEFFHTGALLMKYELTGYMDAGANYVATSFYNCFKNGGLFLFDEIDASNPQAVIAFNQAIENGAMTFPNGEVVKRHADFRCIAAANTNGQGATQNYKRQALDGASLERFVRVEMLYDTKLEVRLAVAEYTRIAGADCDTTIAERFVEKIQHLRKKAADKRIDVIISPRSSIRGCGLLALGDSEKTAMQECFGASLSTDQKQQLGL